MAKREGASGASAKGHRREAESAKACELIVSEIRNEIATGHLTPGDLLPPEEQLLARFQVARATLREAMRILEWQGALAIRRGRHGGAVILKPKVDEVASSVALMLQIDGTTIGDLGTARALIEEWDVRRLAEHAHPDDVAKLDLAAGQIEEATTIGELEAVAGAITNFHLQISELSESHTLRIFGLLLGNLLRDYYTSVLGPAPLEQLSKRVRSYRKLVRLIGEGDPDAAAEHWRNHMEVEINLVGRDRPLQRFSRRPAAAQP
jgi:GntR family transcriptional regulator, transcriptional repressor for pyruvate dehydrogenase complex